MQVPELRWHYLSAVAGVCVMCVSSVSQDYVSQLHLHLEPVIFDDVLFCVVWAKIDLV